MPMALQGWHRGERAIQSKLSFDGPMAMAFTWIDNEMPEQHRIFYSRRLHFVPLTSIDEDGRPWASLVAGDGSPGFIQSPTETTLEMRLKTYPDDPIINNMALLGKRRRTLAAGLGIEFSSRRRNKFAGYISRVERPAEDKMLLKLTVNQALGNCPKYINVREFERRPHHTPKTIYKNWKMSPTDQLPSEVVQFILNSDTVFLASIYEARREEENRFPSHVGMNARGGRPGFIRVRKDARTIIIPDYSGNRLLTSLGNIESTPKAGLTFTDFETGDILYLSGVAKNLVAKEAQEIMPRQNVLTSIHVTGFVFIREALPVRQIPGSEVERSPYSPPIKFLAEEKGSETSFGDVTVGLKSIKVLSPNLATFRFTTSQNVKIKPGQTAILDFSELLGTPQYSHMAPGSESSINDDRVRTWTISSAHVDPRGTNWFDLTMREKERGVVTGALFSIARQLAQKMPRMLDDATSLDLQIRLVGIGGDFTLGPQSLTRKRLLWIAGGIGTTPFMSMLSWLATQDNADQYDIVLMLSTREPDVLLPLLYESMTSGKPIYPKLEIIVFSDRRARSPPKFPPSVSLRYVKGRPTKEFVKDEVEGPVTRDAFLCGPPAFEETAMESMVFAGMDGSKVTREGFAY